MTTYKKFRKLNIDFSAIEFEQAGDDKYFCTPKGARIIGRAGVDGIHYCFVRGQGEMVFAVNPTNVPGRNVFPIANTFEELLSLLLACGSMAAIEQAHWWDEEQFEEFVAENQPTAEQSAVFEVLRDKLGITPMEKPFAYLMDLQNSYNYGELSFPKEYYALFDAASCDEPPVEWKVTMEGDFCAERGKAGEEIAVQKEFPWGDERWHIPAVYRCSGGLVVDFCIELNEERLKAFYQKYKPLEEQRVRLTEEEEAFIRVECPTSVDFHPTLLMNGEMLRNCHSHGQAWISSEITGDDSWEDRHGRWVLEHYGLDLSKAWLIRRCAFPWEGRRKVNLQSLTLHLERDKVDMPTVRFLTPEIGGSVVFTHPVTGTEHTLTVRKFESQTLDGKRFHDDEMEFPAHFSVMTYTLYPDLPGDAYYLKDCDKGDNPRPRHPGHGGIVGSTVGAIAVIRNTGDPSAVFYVDGAEVQLHAVCSSLHFKPVSEPVEWSLSVREKLMADVDIALM